MESCDRYLELLSQSLDGPLSELEQRALQAHLEVCPDCRLLAQQLSQIHGELSTWEDHPVPEGFTQGVMDQIRALNDTPKNIVPLWKRPQFKALGSIAACAVLCLGLWGSGLLSGSTAMDGTAEMAVTAKGTPTAPAAAADVHAVAAEAPAQYSSELADCATVPRVQSEGAIPGEDELLQLAAQATGTQPGCLLVVGKMPEELEQLGQWYYCEGLAFFLFDTLPSQSEQQILIDISDRQIGQDKQPLVLLITH